MGYVNWKECLGLPVHYIYFVVVSVCFYNTASYILSFQLFYKHNRDMYIMSFSMLTVFFRNELLTRKYIGFIFFKKKEELGNRSESGLQNKFIWRGNIGRQTHSYRSQQLACQTDICYNSDMCTVHCLCFHPSITSHSVCRIFGAHPPTTNWSYRGKERNKTTRSNLEFLYVTAQQVQCLGCRIEDRVIGSSIPEEV